MIYYHHQYANMQTYPSAVCGKFEFHTEMQVSWGNHTEIVAMKLLMKAALRNSLNRQFVLLCEATLPMYPPTVGHPCSQFPVSAEAFVANHACVNGFILHILLGMVLETVPR